MPNNNKHIDLIKKLVNGTLSENEKWQLEKLSLDDPFIADALEGFYNNGIDKKRIQNITSKLKAQKPNNKSLVYRWLSIAASLVLLMGISLWLFSDMNPDKTVISENQNLENKTFAKPQSEGASKDILSFNDEETEEALSENEQKEKTTEKLHSSNTPQKNKKDLKTNAPQNSKERNKAGQKRKKENVGLVVSNENDTKQEASKEVLVEQTKNRVSASKEKTIFQDTDLSEDEAFNEIELLTKIQPQLIQGSVRSIDGVPIKNAELVFAKSKKRAFTDTLGLFSLDSVMQDDEIIAFASGFKQTVTNTKPKLEIQLIPSVRDLSEAPMALSQTLDNNQLRRYYTDKLDAFFRKESNLCSKNDLSKKVNISISISENNDIDSIVIEEGVSFYCRTKIENSIRDAAFKGIFNANRSFSFDYSLQSKN